MKTVLFFTSCCALVAFARSSPAQDVRWQATGQSGAWSDNDQFGCSVDRIGDVNGDGVVDFIVGASHENPFNVNAEIGAAHIISGADGSEFRRHTGPSRVSLFGRRVAGGADLDRDGVPDYLVSAEMADPSTGLDAGTVSVYSGAQGVLLYELAGERAADFFGILMSLLDDVDGDGVRDIGVGAPFYDNGKRGQAGRCYVFSGNSGALIWTRTGQQPDDEMAGIIGMGDYNGDGVGDVGIGTLEGGPNDEGSFEICDGQTGVVLHLLVGEAPNNGFGTFATDLGDIDGDGLAEFMVSGHGYSGKYGAQGRVYVFDGATMAVRYQYDGQWANAQLSTFMTRNSRFDFNRDGWGDFLIFNLPNPNWGLDQPTGTLYSGRNGRTLFQFRTIDLYDTLGLIAVSSSAGGDVNGDGIDDLILGDSAWDGNGGYIAGRATLHLGHELLVQADRDSYAANDTAKIRVTGGEPAQLALLALVELGGASLFETVVVAPLNTYGELAFSDTVPPGFVGLTLTFKAFALRPGGGKLLVSATDQITLK